MKSKKLFYIFIFYLILLNPVRLTAQSDSLRAVVFDFKVEEIETNENLSTGLRLLLENGLDLDFKILNRSEMAKIMKEKARRQDLKPLFDPTTAVEEGKFFEARYSIFGQIFKIFGKNYISVRLIDNETTVQIGASKQLSEIDTTEIHLAMEQVAKSLSSKYKQRYSGEYSAITLINKTDKPIVVEDDIIEPSTKPMTVYIVSGKKVTFNTINTSDKNGEEKYFYVNKNTHSQVEIYEENGEVMVESQRSKIFIATNVLTFFNIENNWFVELGYYYHIKDGLYLGISVNGLSTPYNLTYSTFQNADSVIIEQASRDYFISLLLRKDYFIKRIVERTVYGELNIGTSFVNLHTRLQLKGGIELNKWLSFELGYQVYQYNKEEVIFNQYGYAKSSFVQNWNRDLLLNIKINHQF